MTVTPSLRVADRLAASREGRIVVVTADGLGSTYSSNRGVYRALREGFATSAGLMVPCPWARDAASEYRGEDMGVLLTLTAPERSYRWGPTTVAPSLLDGSGAFPRRADDLWEHADVDEVRREARSQLERAILWGVDVTHLASFGAAMVLRPELFGVLLDLAVDHRLPLRLPGGISERWLGFPFRELVAAEGLVAPDSVIELADARDVADLADRVGRLPPGVHEVRAVPAEPSGELFAAFADAEQRSLDLTALLRRERAEFERELPAVLVGWRQVRDIQRSLA